MLLAGAEYAHPWSFIPGFSKINDAFNNAMTTQIEAKSDDPAPVVEATSSAIWSATSLSSRSGSTRESIAGYAVKRTVLCPNSCTPKPS